ncbi:MAG: LPP20 family lipoprotein [Francisella sp.]
MKYLSIKFTIILITSFLLISCSTELTHKNIINKSIINEEIQKNNSYPNWFNTNEINTDNTLYGFGSASTLQQATKNALADMVQRLQVTVSATTKFTNIVNNNKTSQNFTQQVTTKTNQITIPNYQIINQTKINNIFYVKIVANKEQAIQDLQEIINSNITQAKQLLTTTNNKNSLYRFNIAQQVTQKIQLINSSLKTLVILSPDSKINDQIKVINNINNDLLNLKRGLQIYIDKQNSGFFYNSVKKFLLINKYNITNEQDLANIIISLELKDYNYNLNDNKYCIKTKVELQASDNIDNKLSTKIYNIKACSSQGRLTAIDKAVEIFYYQLNNTDSIY